MQLDISKFQHRAFPNDAICWTLVRAVYEDWLGKDIGAAKAQLPSQWRPIAFNELETGDLVLFRESKTRRHAGVHLGDNTFAHYQEGVGVCVGKYSQQPWRQSFRQAYRWAS